MRAHTTVGAPDRALPLRHTLAPHSLPGRSPRSRRAVLPVLAAIVGAASSTAAMTATGHAQERQAPGLLASEPPMEHVIALRLQAHDHVQIGSRAALFDAQP